MAKNPPDERLVYLALRNIFIGADAQLRRPKKIRDLIQRHQGQNNVRDLIQEHNIDNVYNVARGLLEQQIFEYTLKAKIRFPEVFEVSPAQSAERAASEAEAAKTEADAIKDVVEGRQTILSLVEEDELHTPKKGKGKEKDIYGSTRSQKRSFSRATISVPSLYPVYLPYRTQHLLLVKVQAILEAACYSFGQKTMGEVLTREGWDCPESAELSQWPRIFRCNLDKFATGGIEGLDKPLAEILESISELRHTAVHRLRVSANRIEQFMLDSESLANLIEDESCAMNLARLRRETQLAIEELERNKDLLESRLADSLKKIAAKRAELERLEQVAVRDMIEEDHEYQIFAGANLELAIRASETIVQSGAITDNEMSSDLDGDVGSFDEQDTVNVEAGA